MCRTRIFQLLIATLFFGAILGTQPSAHSQTKETPCGVRYTNDDDLFDKDVEWRKTAITERNIVFYNTRKITCDSNRRVLKVWMKVLPRPFFQASEYSIQRFEIQCHRDQTRLISFTDYDSTGKVLRFSDPDNDAVWDDVVPNSVMEKVVAAICRKSP